MGKKGKREDSNYVSKGMLKLVISNIDFLTGCVFAVHSYFI